MSLGWPRDYASTMSDSPRGGGPHNREPALLALPPPGEPALYGGGRGGESTRSVSQPRAVLSLARLAVAPAER